MGMFEQQKLPLACPSCKRRLEASVSTIINQRKTQCPSCGSAYLFDSSDASSLRSAASGLEGAQSSIKRAQAELEKATKRFKEAIAEAVSGATIQMKQKR